MNELDALNELTAEATPEKKKTETTERPILPVPPTVLKPFERLVGAKAIAEVVDARIEVEQSLVNEEMISAFADTLFAHGCRPINPRLKLEKNGRPDLEGLFQVQEKFTFNVQEGSGEYKERLQSSLEQAGLDESVAVKVIKDEIDCNPVTSMKSFNDLMVGHYEGKQFVDATDKEKAVAAKMMEFVKSLPADERKLVLTKKENVKVKDGFLERLKVYCKSAAQVKAIFKIVKPVHFMSRMKYGVSDTPEARNARLVLEVSNILGDAKKK